MVKSKSLLDSRQIANIPFLNLFFEQADEMRRLRTKEGIIDKHKTKVVGSLFYEPSTRTRMSTESAALRLGAKVIGTDNAREFSSAFKGETLEHSVKAIEESFDMIVLRHENDGAAERAAAVLDIPIINAGDGRNQHPTQALLDIYTIRNYFRRIDDLKVAFVGDILNGRTIKSLAYLLAKIGGNEIYFVSPRELGLPADMKVYFLEKGARFEETEDFDNVLPEVDIVYATRCQTERVREGEQQVQLGYRKFQIGVERANKMKDGSIIMHPLPINRTKSNGYPEITPEVDAHPRAHYFRQSNNGLYTRMVILDTLLTGPSHALYNHVGEWPITA